MALQMMLPLIRIKAELLTDHRPRDGTQYGRFTRTVHSRKNMRSEVHVAVTIGEVHFEMLEWAYTIRY